MNNHQLSIFEIWFLFVYCYCINIDAIFNFLKGYLTVAFLKLDLS